MILSNDQGILMILCHITPNVLYSTDTIMEYMLKNGIVILNHIYLFARLSVIWVLLLSMV